MLLYRVNRSNEGEIRIIMKYIISLSNRILSAEMLNKNIFFYILGLN